MQSMLSTVKIYKGELNINPRLKLVVLNEERLSIHLHNCTGRSALSHRQNSWNFREGNEIFSLLKKLMEVVAHMLVYGI